MKYQAYIPVYALTLLLSAALLFSVQPMFSKMILPLLGGTPQVWNTAMLFFQVALLAGYAYAHGTTRLLGIRAQAVLQLVLLIVFVFVLPLGIPEGWLPPVNKDPTLWQLSLMAITVGGPFFVLSGSAPMLQRWFSHSGHPDADNPYFLYGASNLGSMTALLAYPFVIEPLWNLSEQSQIWTGGYIALFAMTLLAAILIWKKAPAGTGHASSGPSETITWARRGLWLLLAFVPSSLMLGVTTFITTDIASVPLLWILPLALYVSTFIIVFARRQVFRREHIILIQGLLLILLISQLTVIKISPALLITLHMVLFFTSALACHTELARLRPHSGHLTEFYLFMALGGALGGVFNAIIAPNFFIIPLEYPFALAATAFLRYAADENTGLRQSVARFKTAYHTQKTKILFSPEAICLYCVLFFALCATMVLDNKVLLTCMSFISAALFFLMPRRWLFALAVCYVLVLFPTGYNWGRLYFKEIIHRDRNFFGVIRVADNHMGERLLLHGTTNHGTQALDKKHRLTPLAYYSRFSPMNDAFRFLDNKAGPQKIAVVGLGIGVTACFDKKGRSFDFYEIDPDIAAVAENTDLFTYLSDCGSPYEIILGDGRLKLAEKENGSYDLFLLDAFSSDNIPIHLLTQEAVAMYMEKLKPGGILIFNISNNFLDIEPVLAQVAKALNVTGYAKYTRGGEIEGTKLRGYASHFFLFLHDPKTIRYFESRDWTPAQFRDGVGLWTDQFSNITGVLGNKSGYIRRKKLLEQQKAEATKN